MISRRYFFGLLLSLPVPGYCYSLFNHYRVSEALHTILAHAGLDPAIHTLGTAFLNAEKHQLNFEELESELVKHIGNYYSMNEVELQRVISAGVRRDFETGSVINIRGWRFSKLEAVVAAMSTFA